MYNDIYNIYTSTPQCGTVSANQPFLTTIHAVHAADVHFNPFKNWYVITQIKLNYPWSTSLGSFHVPGTTCGHGLPLAPQTPRRILEDLHAASSSLDWSADGEPAGWAKSHGIHWFSHEKIAGIALLDVHPPKNGTYK